MNNYQFNRTAPTPVWSRSDTKAVIMYRNFQCYRDSHGFYWEGGAPNDGSIWYATLDEVKKDIDLYHDERANWDMERAIEDAR